MHQHHHACLREKWVESGYILCYIFDVWNKTKLRVKNYTQFCYRL